MALCENMKTLNVHQKEVAQSAGSAKKMMDDAYNNSLDAKVNDLKRSFEGLYEKVLSSDTLKLLITDLAQLVTALSNVDGKTIAFIATMGSLVLVMAKLSTLNKTLMAGEAVSGLSKFIGLATGMTKLETGATGVATAFGFLATSIKGATASSIAFMMTGIGAVIGAIGLVVGLAVANFVKYKEAQAKITKQTQDFKTAINGVNSSLASGDINGARKNLEKAMEQEKQLTKLIEERKKAQEGSNGHQPAGVGGLNQGSMKDAEIKKVTKALQDLGYTVDTTTGNIQQLAEAKKDVENTNIVEKIKSETKAQIENRTNVEANKEEYKNYVSELKNLYSEYQNLSSQENLSSEQKEHLGTVINGLQGKVGNLNVVMGSNGQMYIENAPLIQDTISYLDNEGVTINTLTNIRLEDEKNNASWQYNNTSVTYAETNQRIAKYREEIAEIQRLMQARIISAGAKSDTYTVTDFHGNTGEITKNNDSNDIDRNESHAMRVNNYLQKTKLDPLQDELAKFQSAKDKIDKLYSSPPPQSAPSHQSGNYSPSGGGKEKKGKSGKSDSEKEAEKAQKFSEEIAKMQSDVKTDRYIDFNNAIKGINSSLTENKTLQDATTGKEHEKAQLQEIEIYQKKQIAVQNLNAEQKKEAEELKAKLSQYQFYFDANGKLINSNQRLLEIQKTVNEMGGDSAEDKEKKKVYIDWIKELQENTKTYADLVDDKIPSVTNQFNELGNKIKKVADEMKKANEEIINTLRDEMVKDIMKDQQDKVDKLKKDAKRAEDDEKKSLERKKKDKEKELETEIKKLKDQIKALDDETENNKKKLAKLKAERELWKKDNSIFSKSKISELDKDIKKAEKDVKKDDLDKQVEELEKKKQAEVDNYDERLRKQEDSNKKKQEKDEKTYKKMLSEETAYNKANKYLQEKNITEIEKLLSSHAERWKSLGNTLGSSLGDGVEEAIKKKVASAIGAVESISGSASKEKASKHSNSSGSVAQKGDHVWINNASSDEIYSDASHNNSKGTGHSNGVGSADELVADGYENGFMKIKNSKGDSIGWVENAILNKWNDAETFKTGGRTPDNLPVEGMGAILHKGEKILNQDDTVRFDKLCNHVLITDDIMNKISQYMPNSNYNLPSAIMQSDINKLSSGVTNNNNTNDSKQDISMAFNITNNNRSDAIMNMREIQKVVIKTIKEEGRIFT